MNEIACKSTRRAAIQEKRGMSVEEEEEEESLY